jgi:hypothetical protein
MFLLARLTSHSSRSIAVMIAFARDACGGRGGRMGAPDKEQSALHPALAPSFSSGNPALRNTPPIPRPSVAESAPLFARKKPR